MTQATSSELLYDIKYMYIQNQWTNLTPKVFLNSSLESKGSEKLFEKSESSGPLKTPMPELQIL